VAVVFGVVLGLAGALAGDGELAAATVFLMAAIVAVLAPEAFELIFESCVDPEEVLDAEILIDAAQAWSVGKRCCGQNCSVHF
jgi:hypothetical protein